ncbi:MAG: hypothetical protein GY906_10145 [bacterium]|nr:hypothetical protein [bacterium]
MVKPPPAVERISDPEGTVALTPKQLEARRQKRQKQLERAEQRRAEKSATDSE